MQIPRFCLATLAYLAVTMSASAATTLQFSNATTYATNWANAAGNGGSTLVWGIIVDTNRNGFAALYSSTVLTLSASWLQGLRQGNSSTTGGNLTDDVLYISPNVMTQTSDTIDGALAGQNRIGLVNVPTDGGINAGDPFMLVWFNRTSATPPSSNPAIFGERYGFFTDPSFIIPADTTTGIFVTPFSGADPLKQMNTHFDVPECSTALLGLLGVAGLLRRRR